MASLGSLLHKVKCLILFAFLIKAQDSNACQETLINPQKTNPISKKWIRENLLLGYERTYSSPILETIYSDYHSQAFPEITKPRTFTFQRLSKSRKEQRELIKALTSLKDSSGNASTISIVQAKEILRFLKNVLGAKKLSLYIGHSEKIKKSKRRGSVKSLGFNLHFQTFTMEVETSFGKTVALTVEPSCLEINQDPVTIDSLENTWNDIDSAAQKYSFPSTIYEGGHGGGGTHLHLGWKNSSENLWLTHPQILAQFLELPIKFRSLVFLLGEYNDFGSKGSFPLPFEINNSIWANFNEFLYNLMILSAQNSSPETTLNWLKKKISPELLAHDFYISLKNIQNTNSRIELRFIKSLLNTSDMKAVAEFFIELITALIENRLNDYSMKSWNRRTTRVENLDPLKNLRELKSLFKKLNLDEKLKKQLLQLGGKKLKEYYQHQIEHTHAQHKIKEALSAPIQPSTFDVIQLTLENTSYPKGTKILYFTPESHFTHSPKPSNKINLHQIGGKKNYIFVAAFNDKTDSLIERYIIEIESFMDSRPLKIKGPLKIEDLLNDSNFLYKLFPDGYREIGGLSFDNNGKVSDIEEPESTNSDIIFQRRLTLFFPEIIEATKKFKNAQTLNSVAFLVNTEDPLASKAFFNGIETKIENRDYPQKRLIKIFTPFTLEQRKKLSDMKSARVLIKVQNSIRIDTYWAVWNFSESNYALYNLDSGNLDSQKKALSEWIIDYHSIQEDELEEVFQAYTKSFPDLEINPILLSRYNAYIRKISGSIEN